MSKSEIEKIKAVLSDINRKAKWLPTEGVFPENQVQVLTKALEIAVEALYWYDKWNIKVTKTECGTGLMHPLATQSLKQISEILEAK